MTMTADHDPGRALLAFADTETTGLDPDVHTIWEVGIVLAEHHVSGVLEITRRFQAFVELPEHALAYASPDALRAIEFYQRTTGTGIQWLLRRDVAHAVASLTAGRYLAGNVIDFDAQRLATMLRGEDLCHAWHYHLIDVETLAVGRFAGIAHEAEMRGDHDVVDGYRWQALPPWKSSTLAEALGVDVDSDHVHEALYDADVAAHMYARVHDLRVVDNADQPAVLA